MSIIDERRARKNSLLQSAKAIADRAGREGRDLTPSEASEIDGALKEVSSINAWTSSTAKSNPILDSLDAQARGVQSGAGGHVGLTGRHAKALAESIVNKIGDADNGKGLVAAGTQVVSTILMPTIVEEGKPALSILDVLPTRIVPSPVYSFLQAVSPREPNAKIVAPGETKPISKVSVRAVTNALSVFATLSEPVDVYALSDAANLGSWLSSELLYALQVALADEIVNGAGTPGHFRGILQTSGLLSQAFATDVLTSVRTGLGQLEKSGYQPSVILMSSDDWLALDLKAATTAAVDYRSLPIQQSERRLWGTRVVVAHNLPAKTAVIIGEDSVTLDHDGVISLKFSDSHADSFAKNEVVARAESRWGLSVLQPGAICKVATA